MYKELRKYNTGSVEKVGTDCSFNGKQMFVSLPKYSFPVGNLLEDFVKHLTKPRWKRMFYHKHLTELYKEILNKIHINSSI